MIRFIQKETFFADFSPLIHLKIEALFNSMQIIADLHVHTKYSRATSKDLDLFGLHQAAQVKGIDLIAAGDFTFPDYFKELESSLTESAEHPGLYQLKNNLADSQDKNICPQKAKNVFFILTQEISCIYTKNNIGRRIHILIFAPNLATVKKIGKKLSTIGNLKSDGRPILGLDAKKLAAIVLEIDQNCLIVPAHIWTPWFSLFGSKSGFNSLAECFDDYSQYIYAIETGLSSDPAMNWRLSALDNLSIISCGDAHSGAKIAREAVVFELAKLSYKNIYQAIRNSAQINFSRPPKNYIKKTLEFYPEEGKYHWDGHRLCQFRSSPQESKKRQNICPICRRPLTVGVMARVEKLADRTAKEAGRASKNRPPFISLIPLAEIIAEICQQGVNTKKVKEAYNQIITQAGSELAVLMDLPLENLQKITESEIIVESIKRMRAGQIISDPGYDGVYGKIMLFTDKEKKNFNSKNLSLF